MIHPSETGIRGWGTKAIEYQPSHVRLSYSKLSGRAPTSDSIPRRTTELCSHAKNCAEDDHVTVYIELLWACATGAQSVIKKCVIEACEIQILENGQRLAG